MNNYSFNELLELAKNDINTDAQFALGNLYFYGSPEVKRDVDRAIDYYMFASENKHVLATKILYEIYLKGIYVGKDLEIASYYLEELRTTSFSDFDIEAKYLELEELKEKFMYIGDYYSPEILLPFEKNKDELFHLIEKYQRTLDKDILEKIIIRNLRLVRKFTNKYVGRQNPHYWDYYQEGIIGLMKAIKKFDTNRNNEFSTYAVWWIKQSIIRAYGTYKRQIRLPVHILEHISKIKKLSCNKKHERQTVANYSKNNNLDYEALEKGFEVLHKKQVCLFAMSNSEELEDFKHEEILKESYEKDFVKILEKTLDTEKEIDIIKRRYNFCPYKNQKNTLDEIGILYNVTRERIRQIELKTRKKLRRVFFRNKNYIEGYYTFKKIKKKNNTKDEKQIQTKEILKNKPTYISNTLFNGDEKMIITDPIELIKTKLIKVKKNYDLNPYEALSICKEAIEMQNSSGILFRLEEEKEVYELTIKLLNITGKLNELSPYYNRLQALESLLVPEDEYQKLIREFDEAKLFKDTPKIHKTANKILSKFSGKVSEEKEREIEDVYAELVDSYYNQSKFDEMVITVDEYLSNFERNKTDFEEMIELVLEEKLEIVTQIFHSLVDEEKFKRIIQIGDIVHKRIENNEEISNEDKESFYINYGDYFEKIEKDKASAIFYYREAINYSSDAGYITKQIFELKKAEVVEKYNEKMPPSAMKELLKDVDKLIEESKEYENVRMTEILDVKFNLLKTLDKVEELSRFLLENPSYAEEESKEDEDEVEEVKNQADEIDEIKEIVELYRKDELPTEKNLFNNEAVVEKFMFLEKLIYLKNPQGDFENKLSESLKKIFREQYLYPNQIHKLESELSYILQQWNKNENREKFGFLYEQFIELIEVLRDNKDITSHGALKKLLEGKKSKIIEEKQINTQIEKVYDFRFLKELPKSNELYSFDENFLKQNRFLIDEYTEEKFSLFKLTLKKMNGILQNQKLSSNLKASISFLFTKINEENIDNFDDLEKVVKAYSNKPFQMLEEEKVEEVIEIEGIEFDNDLIYKNKFMFFQKIFRIITPEDEETEEINEALKTVYKAYMNLEEFSIFKKALEELKILIENIAELDFLYENVCNIIGLIKDNRISTHKEFETAIKIEGNEPVTYRFNNESIYEKISNFYVHCYYLTNNTEEKSILVNQKLKVCYDNYNNCGDFSTFFNSLLFLKLGLKEHGELEALLNNVDLVINVIEKYHIFNFKMLANYCDKLQKPVKEEITGIKEPIEDTQIVEEKTSKGENKVADILDEMLNKIKAEYEVKINELIDNSGESKVREGLLLGLLGMAEIQYGRSGINILYPQIEKINDLEELKKLRELIIKETRMENVEKYIEEITR